MIVLDASCAIDLLLDVEPWGARVVERIGNESLYAPHLLDAEVGQVLRRLVLAGRVSAARALDAISDLEALPLERAPHTPLFPRAFELRQNLTVYDGLYVALAEALDATLLTRDAGIGSLESTSARIEVIGR